MVNKLSNVIHIVNKLRDPNIVKIYLEVYITCSICYSLLFIFSVILLSPLPGPSSSVGELASRKYSFQRDLHSNRADASATIFLSAIYWHNA